MSVADPFARFTELFERAKRAVLQEPNAMVLATASADGRPSARVVLLKSFDTQGFVFYTNFESRKGQELVANPNAALCFYWPPIEEQVRVEGRVEKVSSELADTYFASRARGSQLGAWASAQSKPLASREALEASLHDAETRYAEAPVPRPPHWGGFRVVPERIEFWRGRGERLHERTLYLREGDGWRTELLNP